MEMLDLPVLLAVVGGITVLTNIIVQVLKKITWDKVPTNLVALLVAQALTLGSGAAWASLNGAAITWYMAAGAVVAGFLSAYAAMFGFDKLQEMLKDWPNRKT